MPMHKDHHIQSTVALLENAGSSNNTFPFPTIDLDLSHEGDNDVVVSTPGKSAAAAVPLGTSTRSKREIIAFEGFMFDSSVLRDDDDGNDDDDQPSDSSLALVEDVDKHRQNRSFDASTRRDHNDGETPEHSINDTKQQPSPSPSPSPKSSASSLSSSSTSSSPPSSSSSSSSSLSPSSTSSTITAPYSPDQSPGSDNGSAESFFSLTEASADSDRTESPLPSMVSSHDGMAELGLSGDSGDIKEVQIEAEDPSHLFWVPFHMHPEIAPNAYNNWLHKHGVDASGPSTFLAVRKSSVNRRQSVLSAEYNPELDEDDESATESKATDKGPEKDKQVHDSTETDFLSGVFTAPLEQMGEPPLKTKTSLRRSLSHTRNPPPPPASDDGSVDMAAEDLATVRRTGGLTRSGPSLLRRSARTKIRRNSTASNDKNDTSRLRQTVDENGQYPAVTLVDPGPLPLPSDAPVIAVSQPETPSVADPGAVSQATDPKPLKRFVSTLRDPSKPTITTYVEPELLEQQRQEIEGVVPPKPTSTSASLNHISLADPAVYTGAVVSSITYPIPPPVKLTQNLLQHPSQKSRPSPERISQPGKQPQPRQVIPSAVPSSSASAKKSSTWSWLRGKEKEGDVLHDTKPLSQRDTPPTGPPSAPNSKTVAKKPSALSLLFSRNGKTSTKVQLSMAGPPAPVSHCDPQRNTPQDGGYVSDPCRMPIQTERAIYRLSHVKLANPRRPLHEQVLISNMMFWYLGVIEQETEIYQQRQQQQGHPQPVPMPPNHSPSEQAQQQQQQQQQQLYEVNQDPQEVVDQSPPHSSSPSTLKQKRSQPDLSTMEVRVEGSEDFVPQQDSNSHARSPGMEVFVEFIDSETVDYDEESMIGGYAEPYDWSDEEDHRKPADDNSDDGGNSVYLRSGSPVQSGFSVYSTSSLDLANGPGTVSVS